MAKSNIPGIYGYAKGKVGAVVYSTSSAALDGQTRQTIRLKPTVVRNPNTVSQIMQRMKIGPAQLFYSAFEKAAGDVENNPLSHSFEGTPYGIKSRSRFIQLALQGDPKAYVPKGYAGAAPGIYQISEGSLPSLPSGSTDSSDRILCQVNEALTADHISVLTAKGVELGDQITIVGLVSKVSGTYEAQFARVIVGVGNQWEFNGGVDLEGVSLGEPGINFANAAGDVACAAFILSRGTSSASAKRSTAIMTLAPDYEGLMSPSALQAAIDSYLNNTTYNSLNSDWYLNQGSSQAFNGEVAALDVIANGGEGKEIDDRFLVGKQLNNGRVFINVFTSDGTESGQAYLVSDSGRVTLANYPESNPAAPVTGAQVLAGITAAGYDTGVCVQFSAAAAAQGGFTTGA